VILEIDVQGAATVMDKMPEAVSIFIMPPSYDVLRARLTARATEGMEDLELRLKNSLAEVMQFSSFGYVVVNDEISAWLRPPEAAFRFLPELPIPNPFPMKEFG